MACTPLELAELAKCYCFSFEQHLQIQTALLCQIVTNGGGGGGVGAQEVFCGSGSPVGVVVPAASVTCALYINTDTGELWQFYSGVWH